MWGKGTSIPQVLGFLGPGAASPEAPTGLRRRGGYAGTHVAGEVVKAQHHDKDHHRHGALRRHQGQPVGPRIIQLKGTVLPSDKGALFPLIWLCCFLSPRNFSQQLKRLRIKSRRPLGSKTF